MKLESSDFCLCCLNTNEKLVNDQITLKSYKTLIGVELPLNILNGTFWFCVDCKGILETIDDFKRKCLKSVQQLQEAECPEFVAFDSDEPVLIKMELDTILVPEMNEVILTTEEDLKSELRTVEDTPIIEKNLVDNPPKRTPRSKKKSEKIQTEKKRRRKFSGTLKLEYKKTPEGFFCQLCNKKTTRLATMKTHFRKIHYTSPSRTTEKADDERFYCGYCEKLQPEILTRHMFKAHSKLDSDGILNCLICGKKNSQRATFDDHFRRHHNYLQEPKLCCNLVFPTIVKYNVHFAQVHERHYLICDFCGVQLSTKSNMKSHMVRLHMSQEKFKCSICHRFFLEKEKYEKHVEKENEKQKKKETEEVPEEAVICDICGFVAKKKYLLNVHIKKKHLDLQAESKKVTCQYCGQVLKKQSFLKHHIMIHHADGKKFGCHLCQRKFLLERQLNRHIRVDHETLKWVECEICGKEVKSNHLEAHTTISHGPKKFQCEFCAEAFTTSGVLQKHLYQHSGTRPYNCDTCSQGYYCKDYLQKHYLRAHGREVSFKDMKETLPPDYSIVKSQIEQYRNKN